MADQPLETIPLSVLVIDDDRDTAESLTDLLTLHGFAARAVTTVADAERAAADLPDAVVLDIRLPGMNGWDLARRLADAPKPPFLVAVSGCGCVTEADKLRFAGAGIQLHLVKPVDPAVLVGVLRRFARAVGSAET